MRTRAPVRVLDAGGWTDTWFAGSGRVCNLAVDDGVEVIATRSRTHRTTAARTVELTVPAFGDHYQFALDEPPGRHPLLEASLRRWAPRGESLHVTVASALPPGAGLGTSAAVVVALIAALDALSTTTRDAASLARAAHEIETVDLGLQSGVQDQIASATGGCNFITIDNYPNARASTLELPPATWHALADRVVTVYLNAPHRSGELHQMVIESLAATDAENLFEALRTAARQAADALAAGDIDGYGETMIANTETQTALHRSLVSDRARGAIALARHRGAVGWKVNGAGGDGGTVTIVTPPDSTEVHHALAVAGFTVLPLRPAHLGARVIDQT